MDSIIGRRDELAVVNRFLDEVPAGLRVLVLEGHAGIGKSTVLGAALDGASDRSYRVLSCRAAPAEVRMGYAALADLLDAVPDMVFQELPAVQREAIDGLLFRGSPVGGTEDPRAVATAFRSVLEALATQSPVLVAIDDVQWLDDSSRQAVEHAVRRLSGPIGFVIAARDTGHHRAPDLSPRVPGDRWRLDLGALSVAALHELLLERTRRSFPRPMLVRIHQMVAGNPFYALEVARVVGDASTLPDRLVPERLGDLVAERLAGLEPAVQDALLVVSALADPSVVLANRALGPDGAALLGSAAAQGLIAIPDDRVRFVHPLWANGVYSAASVERRQSVHRRLSQVVPGVEERARHLALAAVGPDRETLTALASAADQAKHRGAPAAAAELLELAISLGTEDPGVRVQAAECHFDAGDPVRAAELVEEAVAAFPSGSPRAAALGLLGRIRFSTDDHPKAIELLEQARTEASEDPGMRVAFTLALCFAFANAGRLADAVEYVEGALVDAERSGGRGLLAQALAVRVLVRFLSGEGLDEVTLARAVELEERDRRQFAYLRPRLIAAFCTSLVGRLDEAKQLLDSVRDDCVARGQDSDIVFMAGHLTLVECWRGDIDAAHAVVADAWERAAMLGGPMPRGQAAAALSMVHALAGDVDECRRSARESLAALEQTGDIASTLSPLGALCLIEASLGNYQTIADELAPFAMEAAAAAGGQELMLHVFVPDVVEAYVALGRYDEAEPLVAHLEERGRTLDRAWGLATGGRCRGLLLAARGDMQNAETALRDALVQHDRLAMPFEGARTLLVLGTVQRRANQRRAARESLIEAQRIFEIVGAARWVERARAELGRLGGRTATPTELTETERRIAELAASGMTNRDIAGTLFVSAKTVEANLARVYRKLGIRSRTDLPRTPGS